MTDKPLSPAMISALQAVSRMKGDSAIAWSAVPTEGERDDRYAPAADPPQQGWKPAGR
jgi:hypothetical protein